MYRGELSLRVIACTFVIQFVRLSHVSLVKHIRAGKRVLLRKLVVHLGRKIVLRRYRLPCKCERSEEHTSELQSRLHLVCRLLLEKKKKKKEERNNHILKK